MCGKGMNKRLFLLGIILIFLVIDASAESSVVIVSGENITTKPLAADKPNVKNPDASNIVTVNSSGIIRKPLAENLPNSFLIESLEDIKTEPDAGSKKRSAKTPAKGGAAPKGEGSCSSDINCPAEQICNQGFGLCVDLETGLVDGYIEIVDITPSVCNGQLVDIIVEGIYPIQHTWIPDSDLFSWLAIFNPWTTDCLLSFDFSSGNVEDRGYTYTLRYFLYENDPPNLADLEITDDLIAEQAKTAKTSIGMEETGIGSCIAVPFQYTFRNVNLGPFFSESLEGNHIEIWAAVEGTPHENLVHSTDIIVPLGEDDSWKSNDYSVLLDNTPPPQPNPQANPSGWTTDTTPNILGYTVVDPGSMIDHYEYQIDSTAGSWTNIGTATNFDVPSQPDGVHTVYVRAVDACNPGTPGSVDIYIDSNLNCECSSGSCCSDGCYFDAAGTYCNEVELDEYQCLDGNSLGSDVYVRERHQECPGSSSACSGAYYYGWVIKRDCEPDEYCANNGDSSCTSCSTTCDYSCQSATCYGVDPDCTAIGGSTKCTDLGGSCSGGSCGINCIYNPADPCVDSGGCLRPGGLAYYICQQDVNVEYGCKEGYMAGDDVWKRSQNRYCSGTSPLCDGPLEWSWRQVEDCSLSERCANDGDTSCTAVPPESCNGADDDYDGVVDDNLIGNLCPKQQGVCNGARQQCIGGAWQSCTTSTYGDDYESVETRCDNKDNDCDNSVDENLVRSCGVTSTGACTMGTETCSSGSWSACTAVFPTNEICDGIDSDCDGVPDGSENLGTQQCYDIANKQYAGIGACSYGYYECTDSGWSADCIGDVAPAAEICDNGADDDCDGYADIEDDECRCDDDGDCPADGWGGSLSCNGNNVWQYWRNYSCVNPGANNSYCSYTADYQQKEICSETCSNGVCVVNTYGYMWNTDVSKDQIYKLTANGTILDNFSSPGPNPRGLTFDGAYLWNVDYDTHKLYKLTVYGFIVEVYDTPDATPSGLTFDGDFLWNADYSAGKIYKLTADGTIIGSFSAPCPGSAGLAWDGNYLWNNNYDVKKIYKLTTGGAVIDVLDAPGTTPTGLAWDGNYLLHTDWTADKIFRITTDGIVIANFSTPGGLPYGLAWQPADNMACSSDSGCGTGYWYGNDYCNGNDVWDTYRNFSCINPGTVNSWCSVFDVNTSKQTCSLGCENAKCLADGYLWNVDYDTKKIYKLDTDGNVLDSFDGPGISLYGLTWDGNYLWVANSGDKIYKLTANGTIIDSFNYSSGSADLAWDGTYLWNSDPYINKIRKLATNGTIVSSFNTPGPFPKGLAWDGVYLWHADYNRDKIYKLTTNGTTVDSFNSPGVWPTGLAWDGTYLWNADYSAGGKIYKLTANGTVIKSFSSPALSPEGLAFQPIEDCTSHDHYGCYDSDVYWYDSCNNREEKKEECGTSGYAGNNYCHDNDVYRNYTTKGCSGSSCTSSTNGIKQQECGADGCSGGSCITCTSHDHYGCYDSDVYWYDSCNNREEKKEECGADGCSGGSCITCTSHDHYSCYDSDVYWYDSCNNREEKKEECGADGCSGGACESPIPNCIEVCNFGNCYEYCI